MVRRTKAESEATRESLLDAAEQVFMQRGVDNASLEEIARTAGVTRGAFYWHFRNKEDVFDAMLSRVRLPLQDMINDLLKAGVGGIPRLMELCSLALKQLAECERHQRVYTILLHRTSADLGRWRQGEIATHSIAQMTTFFSTQGAADLHPHLTPQQAAIILHTQMLGIFNDWLRDPSAWCLKTLTPVLIGNLFRGLTGRDW